VVGGREFREGIALVEVGEEVVPHPRGEGLARVLQQGLVDVRRLRGTPRCGERDHGGAVADPLTAVRHDVSRLRSVVTSPDTTITGLVYDLESGTVRRA